MIGGNNFNIPSVLVTSTDDNVTINNNNNKNSGSNKSAPPPTFSSEDVRNDNSIVCDDLIENAGENNVICLLNGMIDLNEIPVSSLGFKCRAKLSDNLNSKKILPTEDGIPRDWRGVLHCLRLDIPLMSLNRKDDPMGFLLDRWMTEYKENASLGQLQQILGTTDRWDVLDDTHDMFVEDAKDYLKEMEKQKRPESVNISDQLIPMTPKDRATFNILTDDDQRRNAQGLSPQQYDAFILFADEDTQFATSIIEKMEECELKICAKQRDFIGGVFEPDAMMRMITERCERLVVVLSNAFYASPANEFFTLLAQAFGVEQRLIKIIPCVYESLEENVIPPSLRFHHIHDFRRASQSFIPYEKLRVAIRGREQMKQVVNHSFGMSLPKIMIEAPSPIHFTVTNGPQALQATSHTDDSDASQTYSLRKRKDKSKLQRLSISNKKKQTWSVSPKFRLKKGKISSSMLTLSVGGKLDANGGRCHSSLSLNTPASSPTASIGKKPKWYKKFLSPSIGNVNKLAADSDSSLGMEKSTKKKKSWYKKRFRSRSKNPEREMVKEI